MMIKVMWSLLILSSSSTPSRASSGALSCAIKAMMMMIREALAKLISSQLDAQTVAAPVVVVAVVMLAGIHGGCS